MTAAEELDDGIVADVEGDEADGEGGDLVADAGDADVVDDLLDLRLGPLEQAVVGVHEGGRDERWGVRAGGAGWMR